VTKAAPTWLQPLLKQRPDAMQIRSNGTEVELLVWGKRGLPGLFLLHGASANAHWWDWVAPLLAQHYRVAAMSLPGCGGSDWRDRYASRDFCEDAFACARAAGLEDTGLPVYVGHSMGGAHLFHGAANRQERMRALVLIDSSFRTPGTRPGIAGHRRFFTSEAEALAHFRLAPAVPIREPALVEYVAHASLIRLDQKDGSPRWAWSRDPDFWAKLEPGLEQGPYSGPVALGIPAAHLIADSSHVLSNTATTPLEPSVPRIVLPDCSHHIMLDRPLVLVAALRALLAVWP
jgi:pimeloyl-ACP methyl ester carboxylesterase